MSGRNRRSCRDTNSQPSPCRSTTRACVRRVARTDLCLYRDSSCLARGLRRRESARRPDSLVLLGAAVERCQGPCSR